ncbi:OmpA family protein [Micromonospora matsumotoense]|uniref:OmpA family protein n=1 Tax=Micromonospora matsumotoense TaxID=121616 RepID=A0A1C5A8W4_9ACTN|nr:OmpA family protein [Micromonospora matsumotoense]SCF41444.1 OmpA family protein [Micromonospora matsumotoense]
MAFLLSPHSRSRTVRPRRVALVAGLLLAAAVLTGCDDPPKEEPVEAGCLPSGVAMSLAIGARANSPTPALPELVEDLARSAARKHKGVSVVQVDGRADVDLGPQVFDSKAENGNKYEKDLARWLDGLRQYVAKMQADEPEADVLKALDVAAAQVGPGDTVVLVDSGLQTTAPLDFRTRGTLDADPTEVVEFLRRSDSLPDLTDRHVLLVGVGDTAPPQAELDVARRRHVVELWTAVAKAGGARCVELRESPNGTRSGIDSPPVSVVPVAAIPPFAPCGDTVLPDEGAVGFVPDSARFRDPKAARAALTKLAALLAQRKSTVELIGTTSSAGTEPGRLSLSRDRARAVEAVLRDLGVPPGRVSSKGVGDHWPNRRPDRGPNGELLPGPAAQNRTVVVRILCG